MDAYINTNYEHDPLPYEIIGGQQVIFMTDDDGDEYCRKMNNVKDFKFILTKNE